MDSDPIAVAVAMLGLPGFVVLAAGDVGGEVELLVETTDAVSGCPSCGVLATAHGRREHLLRDVPWGGRPVVLVWCKRVWRCDKPRCAKRTWTETSEHVAPRAVLTERARWWASQWVGHDDGVAKVAR